MASSAIANARPPLRVMPLGESGRTERLPAICWRQWQTERTLRQRGIDFRAIDAEAARRAYAEMTPAEFAAINGRQTWANARTIRRSLAGLLPRRPVVALDLGSGTGGSTACLAELLPAGSRIIGVEIADSLIEIARRRFEDHADRRNISIEFVSGFVTETFHDPAGLPLASESVNLVNASGIVGHHLDRHEAESMAQEISRVLKPRGIAALDIGPKFSSAELTVLMSGFGFERLRRTRSNPFDRTGQVVFRKL